MTDKTEALEVMKIMAGALEFYASGKWNDRYPGGVCCDHIKFGTIDTGEEAQKTLTAYQEFISNWEGE